WPSIATPSASTSATMSNTEGCTGSRSGPPDQPGTSIVLYPPAATPGVTDDERRTIAEMMAKGTYASINLATADLDATFDQVQAGGADVVQEPTDQPDGVRDCSVRDPAATLTRTRGLRWPGTGAASRGGGWADRGETMSMATRMETHPPALPVADSHDLIHVHGARVNNLK